MEEFEARAAVKGLELPQSETGKLLGQSLFAATSRHFNDGNTGISLGEHFDFAGHHIERYFRLSAG